MAASVSIGGIALEHPAILAPMSGVTDWPFRRMVRMLGGGLVVSEMIASAAILSGVRKEMRKLSTDAAAEFPFSLQLAGWDPAVMADAAKIGADLGAAIIDINMGCPARKVTGKLSGSALMREEPLVAEFCCCPQGCGYPCHCQDAAGWDDQMRNAPHLAHIAEKKALPWLPCMAGHAVSFIHATQIGRPSGMCVKRFPSHFSSMVTSTRLPMLIRPSPNLALMV